MSDAYALLVGSRPTPAPMPKPAESPERVALREIAALVMEPGLFEIEDMLERLLAVHARATDALEGKTL